MSNIEMRLYGDSVDMLDDIREVRWGMAEGDTYHHADRKIVRGNGAIVYFRTVAKPSDSDRLAGMIWNDTYLHGSLLEAHPHQREVRDEVLYLLSRQRAKMKQPFICGE